MQLEGIERQLEQFFFEICRVSLISPCRRGTLQPGEGLALVVSLRFVAEENDHVCVDHRQLANSCQRTVSNVPQ